MVQHLGRDAAAGEEDSEAVWQEKKKKSRQGKLGGILILVAAIAW